MKEFNEIVMRIEKHEPLEGKLLEEEMFLIKNYQYDIIKEMLRKFEYLRANDLD